MAKTFQPNQPASPPPARPRRQKSNRRPPRRSSRYSLTFISLWLALIGLVALLTWLTLPGAPVIPGAVATASDNGLLAASTNNTLAPLSTPILALSPGPKSPAANSGGITPISKPSLTASPTPQRFASLESVVQSTLAQWKDKLGKEAKIGIVVQHAERGERAAINNGQLFEAASSYKLYVLLTVYNDIAQGKLSLDQPITLTSAAASDDDMGSLIVPVGGSLPVRNLLEAMIKDSNNTAALMLLFHVRAAHLRQVAAEQGFKNNDLSDTWNFRTSPEDLANFFVRLSGEKLLGSKYDQEMLALLQRANNNWISALLPPGTKVAHKPGYVSGTVNDSGVIYLPNGQHLVISVTLEQANPQAGRQFISQLALAAYQHYVR